ncbi:MAG: tetratricopeptide repeat protein, partial [Myxococcota bacterium]
MPTLAQCRRLTLVAALTSAVPGCVSTGLRRAQEHTAAGKYEAGIAIYKELLQDDPALAEAHWGLGVAYFKLGRFAEAASELEQLRNASATPAATALLAEVYYRLKDVARAQPLALRAVAASPNDVSAHHLLGVIYRLSGDPAAATRELERALELDIEDDAVAVDLASVQVALGRFPDAAATLEAALRRAQEGHRSTAAINFALGPVYDALGLAEEAERVYRLVLQLRPSESSALVGLG